jgi:hypothetical protein
MRYFVSRLGHFATVEIIDVSPNKYCTCLKASASETHLDLWQLVE